MSDEAAWYETLRASLSPMQRLALAYAPARVQASWCALLALDRRLAQTVGRNREPGLTQLRLSWWRDMFAKPVAQWPHGEPLLTALTGWPAQLAALGALVDGWEHMIGPAPIPQGALSLFVDGRVAAMSALSHRIDGGDVTALARRWALADLGCHVSDVLEREQISSMLAASARPRQPTGRAMRPLAVLNTLCERAFAANRPIGGAGDLASAMRVGLFGR
ncbi:hypothetical protein RM533_02010 [Croceicoccus sp. F390]|uniref:Phytoene synthase n=1 Tax=Croceicoccus esteveae TaxID=3075597 RepID=A0ABU2ZED5_9SPHN|nr:hypothetical protein [Croceicoccus sp. F390]MDT0574955.1 hypothetical protein [Croceicoccus sp. F390]